MRRRGGARGSGHGSRGAARRRGRAPRDRPLPRRVGGQRLLHLAAVEYIVDKATWDATHAGPPHLFGQDFLTVPEGNRYGLAAFYEIHAWLWKPNPSGFFNDWNPRVIC